MDRTFRHPIQIMSAEPHEDEIGNHGTADTLFYSCRANVNGVGGKEYFEAGRTVEEGEATFEVRFCRKLKELDAGRHFILFRGARYDISYIDNFGFLDDTLKLRAKRREQPRDKNAIGTT